MSDDDVAGVRLQQPQAPQRPLPDGNEVSTFLASRSARGWSVDRCQGQVLRASRSRPILRYRVSYVDAGRELSVEKIVIGKAYYRGDGAGTHRFMSELWDKGLSIPEPMGYVPELHLLLQGQAAGHPLYDHLVAPEEALPLARESGRWLARLHGVDVRSAAPLPADFEARKLAAYRAELVSAVPELAEPITDLTARTLDALSSLPPVPLVPTHGDYQPKNIHVSLGRVTVIDWDRFALAHPARDAGHFLGQCLTMSYSRHGSFTRVASWNQAFLEGYVAEAPFPLGLALPVYVARTFLEILYYKLVVRPVRDPQFVPAWLDECTSLLDSGSLGEGT